MANLKDLARKVCSSHKASLAIGTLLSLAVSLGTFWALQQKVAVRWVIFLVALIVITVSASYVLLRPAKVVWSTLGEYLGSMLLAAGCAFSLIALRESWWFVVGVLFLGLPALFVVRISLKYDITVPVPRGYALAHIAVAVVILLFCPI